MPSLPRNDDLLVPCEVGKKIQFKSVFEDKEKKNMKAKISLIAQQLCISFISRTQKSLFNFFFFIIINLMPYFRSYSSQSRWLFLLSNTP